MSLISEFPSVLLNSQRSSWLTWLIFSLLGILYGFMPGLFLAFPLAFGCLLFLFTNLMIWTQARNQIEIMGLLPQLAVLSLWWMPAMHYELVAHYPGIMQTPMAVESDSYFKVAIPGVLALCWAYFLPLPGLRPGVLRANLNQALAALGARPRAMALLAAGCLFGFFGAPQLLPAWMQFLGLICRALLYPLILVAVFQADTRYRFGWLGGIALLLATDLIQSTNFGELIGVLAMLLLYAVFIRQWAVSRIFAAQLVFGLLLYWMLAFKFEFRKTARDHLNFPDRVSVFFKSAAAPLAEPVSPKITDVVISRLNQGHLMALALRYVPAQQPFVHGETIWTAVKASLVPRICWPDKPKAGGVDNIRRFMGVENLSHSINLGLVGEAYVNYGVGVAFILFLMAYVLFFRLLSTGILFQSNQFPWLLLLLPSMFFIVNFVEKDVVTILNHVMKQAMVFGFAWMAFFWIKSRKLYF